MRRSRVVDEEMKLEAERHLKYRGIAWVRLENLNFPLKDSRELDRKNVERLKELFQKDTIRRLDSKNRIPAEIDEVDLNEAIRISDTSAESLMHNRDNNPPFLKFPSNYQLTCLHGRHRIVAAREILPSIDSWWAVDLYLTNVNPEVRRSLIEEYSNEDKPSDGEIYRKVRQYEREGNILFKKRWMARLTDHGRRSLRQLFDYEDGELTAAFDKLLDVPGLWSGMRISTLHKLLDMKCYEETLHYLEHIRQFWHRIFHGDKNALSRVNNFDVKSLELKAPGYSTQDAQVLKGELLSGQIFSNFNQLEREAIWGELQSIDFLVPSLFTLFEDLKYLGACADSLKRLVRISRRDTVYSALQRKFRLANELSDQYAVEISQSTFVNRSIPAKDCFDIGYRQLWAFAMRNYKEIPPDTKKKKKDLLAKCGVEKADETMLSEFAALADRLGFASPEIQTLKQSSSDREIALQALLKARKPDWYQYDETTLTSNVAQIMKLFSTASVIARHVSPPVFVSNNINTSGNRCGFPNQDTHEHDKKTLFLPYLHTEDREKGKYITSFFVRRSVYYAFFGKSTGLGVFDRSHLPIPVHENLQGADISGLEESDIDMSELHMPGSELERNQTEMQQQGRVEQERAEQERAEQERAEQERAEQERAEQERVEQERAERERAEQERAEQERVEQERAERERVEQERAEQDRAEQERAEVERAEREKIEQERAEVERAERERIEQERVEQERAEQEKILEDPESIGKRHTRIDMESLITEKVSRNNSEHLKDDQLKCSYLEKNNHDTGQETPILDTQPREGLPLESPASHNLHTSQNPVSSEFSDQQGSTSKNQEQSRLVRITFKVRERDIWKTSHYIDVDPLNSSDAREVHRMAIKHMRKGMRLFDSELNILRPPQCLEAAIASGSNIIFVIPEVKIDIDKKLEDSIFTLNRYGGFAVESSKRSRK
ncbi:hypothetical protein BTUL_0306g00130 [Botrytis tulipae]|uniref:Uncharacterized protein n=1 Tax=Botrytis tulipae TaxID=87230 RepID=A0A4Z1E595_9HELO|nr:hypothetical protein BTUL_0306g00130 [Botrytis tulipae]